MRCAATSAVETVRAALAGAHRIRHLRAFVELWPESALECAAQVDARVADGARLPLAGVPLAMKAVEGTCQTTVSEPGLALTDPARSWLSRPAQNSSGDQPGTDRDNLCALAELFGSADLLATPTTPNPPHPHSGPGEVMSVGFTWLFNLTGHPALSLPAGLTRDGLPVGLHLVARHHEDALLLAAARSAEQALPSLPENPLGGGAARRSCSI